MDRVLAGRYELEVPLGRGGSGEVWRARDMATHRPVAVKIVELSQIDDAGTLAETIGRFRREATVIGELRHQNIVAALDAGRIANQLFMVMELAPGISLAGMMDERGARGMGLFPVSSVLRMAEQVCAGLAAAHAAGVVHRDIKPSNLMVTPQLGVKIIDFGIARLLADNSPRLTLPAQTVGTIAYMSPEQAQGLDVDGRADLYSLGCVLYQLLSGRPPFFSSLPGALLMMQVMDRPAPLDVVRPDLPAGLSQLVGDLLEKEPAARPATAAEVGSRIAEIGRELGVEEPEYEADRETIRAADHLGAVGDTRLDESWPQSERSTVLTPERSDGFSRPIAAGRRGRGGRGGRAALAVRGPANPAAAAAGAVPGARPARPAGGVGSAGGHGHGQLHPQLAGGAAGAASPPGLARRRQHADHRGHRGGGGGLPLGTGPPGAEDHVAQGHRRQGVGGMQRHGGHHRHDQDQRPRRADQVPVAPRRGGGCATRGR